MGAAGAGAGVVAAGLAGAGAGAGFLAGAGAGAGLAGRPGRAGGLGAGLGGGATTGGSSGSAPPSWASRKPGLRRAKVKIQIKGRSENTDMESMERTWGRSSSYMTHRQDELFSVYFFGFGFEALVSGERT